MPTEPEPFRPPVLERPIVILSAPRAGSTLLFETLAQAAGVYTIGGESHQLDREHRRAPAGSRSRALQPPDAQRCDHRDRRGAAPAVHRAGFTTATGSRRRSGANVRLLEKTPKNALRVPFLLEVFPDAQFIFLHRDPRANLSSMMQAWRAKGWVTYRQLPGWPGPWSLLLPPGYERLRDGRSRRSWRSSGGSRTRPSSRTSPTCRASAGPAVRYEDLVGNPRAEIEKLLGFAGLAMDARLEGYLSKPLPLSKHTQTKPDPDKWKQNAAEIERVMPSLAAIIARLGA